MRRKAGIRRIAVATALLCGCGYFGNWVREHRSPTITGAQFRSLAVILGTVDLSTTMLADQIEQELADTGLTIVPRPGRWRSEVEALEEICPLGAPPPVDGVLFVWPDRLQVRDCRTHAMAYEVQSERARTEELVKRLSRYLGDGP